MSAVYGGTDWVCGECGEIRIVDGDCLNCKDLEVLDNE